MTNVTHIDFRLSLYEQFMAYLVSNPSINLKFPSNSNFIIYTTKEFKGYKTFNEENDNLKRTLLSGGESVVKVIKNEGKDSWTVTKIPPVTP